MTGPAHHAHSTAGRPCPFKSSLLLCYAKLVAFWIPHNVPMEVGNVVALNESSTQGLSLSPQSRGIGVVQVQMQAPYPLSGCRDLLERELRKPGL